MHTEAYLTIHRQQERVLEQELAFRRAARERAESSGTRPAPRAPRATAAAVRGASRLDAVAAWFARARRTGSTPAAPLCCATA